MGGSVFDRRLEEARHELRKTDPWDRHRIHGRRRFARLYDRRAQRLRAGLHRRRRRRPPRGRCGRHGHW